MPIRLELKCIDCGATFPLDEVRYTCNCGGLLDMARDLEELREQVSREAFDARIGGRKLADASGVWRFRELILPVPEDQIVSRPEGNTPQYRSARLAQWVGLDDLALKHEGENPTGSFKDRGMTMGVTQAKQLGARGGVRFDRGTRPLVANAKNVRLGSGRRCVSAMALRDGPVGCGAPGI